MDMSTVHEKRLVSDWNTTLFSGWVAAELSWSHYKVETAQLSKGMTCCTCTMILSEHFQAHRHFDTDLLWLSLAM